MATRKSLSILVITFCSRIMIAYCEPKSCKALLDSDSSAPSGVYVLQMGSKKVKAYCEMGLNGGGYTFLSPEALSTINNADLQAAITDHASLLLRIRKTDGTQPYAVLQQHPSYKSFPVNLLHNSWTGYQKTQNEDNLGTPYLYAGFITKVAASNKAVQGITSNGVPYSFTNCDSNANSYIALFPNFKEKAPNTYTYEDYAFCNGILSGVLKNPSGRVMPPEFYMFGEFHFGGCGCYYVTDDNLRSRFNVLGIQIGFK